MNDAELCQRMAELPEPPGGSHPPLWDYWRHDLWRRVVDGHDPRGFTEWPCIYHTMLVRHFPMEERRALLPGRYRAVIDRLPEPFNGNAVEQAWNLTRWEAETGRRVEELGCIYELGGGFGHCAWLCHALGFTGRYVIRDLPEFELLQRWWLGTQGVEAEWAQGPLPCDLFVGCYSLSEIPPEERPEMVPDSPHALLLYTEKWAYGDNAAWFRANIPGRHVRMHDRDETWYVLR